MDQLITPTTLEEMVEENRSHIVLGQTVQYIPALANKNPNQLGICMATSSGEFLTAGDFNCAFTLQSISKILTFIYVCDHYGLDYVLEKVDVEPTGEAFNSIIPFEIHRPGKPFNPLINAGAIIVSSMLPGQTTMERYEGFLAFLENLIGFKPTIDEEVYDSEWRTAHRNRALAYYLKESNLLKLEVDEALEIYIRQCSICMSLQDLAKIGLILAYEGQHPLTHIQHFSKDIAQIAKVLMVTCGMYNSSGKFAAHVGIPAKSGVSGGILAAAPPKCGVVPGCVQSGYGIAVYSPAIDLSGNSTAGTMLLKQLSKTYNFSIF
jgi:glutaminase